MELPGGSEPVMISGSYRIGDPERIAVNTGVKLEAIFDLLGLNRTTQEFREIQAKLQARKRV
jgi:hypothetical protein